MEGTCHFRLLSTKRSKDDFGFFAYAREIAKPAPPTPLRQIHSLMRFHNCRFLVEEELHASAACEEETQLLRAQRNIDERRVLRLSFFGAADRRNFAPIFATRRAKAERDSETDLKLFLALCDDAGLGLQCLGYVDLYTEFRGNEPVHCYVHDAVVRVPQTAFPQLQAANTASVNDQAPDLAPSKAFIHSKPTFLTRVLGREFAVPGSFFAQQQSVIACCAHAAAMVALKNVYTDLNLPCSVNYEDMNRLLEIDHDKLGRLASDGLSPREIACILEELGHLDTVVIQSPEAHPDLLVTSAYQAVESGFPAVICFQGLERSHAMTVVGHTFEPGLWPGARAGAYFRDRLLPYLPSHAWVEGLVVQDDNFGPYCFLPRRTLLRRNPSVIIPRFPWAHEGHPELLQINAHRLLTERFIQRGDSRRTLLQDILASEAAPRDRQANPWFFEVLEHVAKGTYVLRAMPCTMSRYADFLKEHPEILGDRWELIHGIMAKAEKEPFWLVEISIPELYQWNSRRLGEMLLHGDAGAPGEGEATVVRLPGVLSMIFDRDHVEHHQVGGDYHYDIEKRESTPLGSLLACPWSPPSRSQRLLKDMEQAGAVS